MASIADYGRGMNFNNMNSYGDTEKYLKDPNQPLSRYEDILSKGAMSEGPSASARYLGNAMDQETANAASTLSRRSMGNVNAGLTKMGMTGGVKSGARERMVNRANIENARGTRSMYGALGSAKSRMLAGDEQGKQNQLLKMMEMANQRYGFNTQARAQADSARAQMDIAENTGGIFGQGGFFGTGFKF